MLLPQRNRLPLRHTFPGPQATSSRSWTTEPLREWPLLLYPVKTRGYFCALRIGVAGNCCSVNTANGGASPTAPRLCKTCTHNGLLSVIGVDSRVRRGRRTQDCNLAVDLVQERVSFAVHSSIFMLFSFAPPVQQKCTSKYKAWDLTPWCSLRALQPRAS